jgi:hypothetical protein
MTAVQLELIAVQTGPSGFPVCTYCNSEGIGPFTALCVACWTPERDPEGAASARKLGLLS